MVTGQFSYTCEVASGIQAEEDCADAMLLVLEQHHYHSGGSPTHSGCSFFPKEILTQYTLDTCNLKQVIRDAKKAAESNNNNKSTTIRTPAKSGARKQTDDRALQFCIENAVRTANEKALVKFDDSYPKTSVDGTAIKELASMLSLDRGPRRIECYDISHTRGDNAVGSRVVFIDGKPARHLYRTFNIKGVEGVDDYACIEEVLERRFARAWANVEQNQLVDQSDPWALPDLVVIDGGKGQLSAAVKGMMKANVYPEYGSLRVVTSSGDDYKYDEYNEFTIHEEQYPPRRSDCTVPVVALAKKNEELFVKNNGSPISNSTDSSALLLLRALRDESHRRALNSHRLRRKKMNGL
jgi:excinuclease ABC subunit C